MHISHAASLPAAYLTANFRLLLTLVVTTFKLVGQKLKGVSYQLEMRQAQQNCVVMYRLENCQASGGLL